jgi:hypothetical protein
VALLIALDRGLAAGWRHHRLRRIDYINAGITGLVYFFAAPALWYGLEGRCALSTLTLGGL